MSQRERKSKDEPGRALPNLPKFLQGKPKPTPAPGASSNPPAPPAKKAPPADADAKADRSSARPSSSQPPKPPAPESPASKPSTNVPGKTPDRPTTTTVPDAPASIDPAKKSAPKTRPEQPRPAKAVSADAAKSTKSPEPSTPLAKRSEPARPPAPPAPSSDESPVSAEKRAPSPASDLKKDREPTGDPAEASRSSHADATETGEERNGKNGFAVDDVLPQAVSFSILREAMAAEKQFRPILFAGPLKRVAKTPAHPAPAVSLVADRVSQPTLPGAKVASNEKPVASPAAAVPSASVLAEATQDTPVVAREAEPTPKPAAPQLREAESTPPSADVAEAPGADTRETDAGETEPSVHSEASARERDRRAARRRKQVSSILVAAASRAKAASADEIGESEAVSPFADPWDHLRRAAAAAPRDAGPTIRLASDESEEEVTPEKIVRRTPPFAASLLLHLAIFVLLAILVLPGFEASVPVVLDLNYATEDSELLETIELDLPTDVAAETSDPFSTELTEMADPLAGTEVLPEAFESLQLVTPSNVAQVSVGFSGRDEGTKQALFDAFGGTIATEDAVKLGLGWMKRQQQPDGRWLLSGPYANGCSLDNPAAATSMAMLAFLGDGHTPEKGDFRQTMTKGADALLRFQDSDGNFYVGPEGQHRLYTQAQATIAVCELYGMTGDERYRDAAKLAVEYCLRAQAPEGGWRYYPGQESDTSVTGWFVMALESAEMANLEVPQEAFDRISGYLDRVQDEEGWRYKYRIIERDFSKTMTAEGILCRQYLGWDRDDLRMKQGVDYLLQSPIAIDEREVYYWYYASQAMHHYGGPEWDEWNANLREVLPAIQEKKGREQGSWSPRDDEWGSVGGRLFMTSLCLYTLEIYYRHLPLYQQAGETAKVPATEQ